VAATTVSHVKVATTTTVRQEESTTQLEYGGMVAGLNTARLLLSRCVRSLKTSHWSKVISDSM